MSPAYRQADRDDDWAFRSPIVTATGRVSVLGDDDQEPIVTAAASETVRLKVKAPFRIVVDGAAYRGGDELTVPRDRDTEQWIRAGWVQIVPAAETKPTKAGK